MSNESENITIIRVPFSLQDMQAWQKFVVGLRSENRFTLAEEPARFLELIIDYAKKHKTVSLPRNTLLYRARINDSNSKALFPLDSMSAPPAHLAGHGRLNPKGIPYLYLASDQITAVSEVHPWVGCELTVAEFSLVDDCELVNFSTKHFVNIPVGEQFEGPEFTWRELITRMFSVPFDPRDDTAYIPTQYLAERIKGAGFSGIIYDSSLNTDGYNVTLFDVKRANAIRRKKSRVTAAKVEARFDEIAEDAG
jgi:RES domain-containing protein